jgi:hypothetical protein
MHNALFPHTFPYCRTNATFALSRCLYRPSLSYFNAPDVNVGPNQTTARAANSRRQPAPVNARDARTDHTWNTTSNTCAGDTGEAAAEAANLAGNFVLLLNVCNFCGIAAMGEFSDAHGRRLVRCHTFVLHGKSSQMHIHLARAVGRNIDKLAGSKQGPANMIVFYKPRSGKSRKQSWSLRALPDLEPAAPTWYQLALPTWNLHSPPI